MIHVSMKNLLIICLVVSLSACSVFGDRVVDQVSSTIDKYCEESYDYRVFYYEQINQELAVHGHYIAVVCAGDPEDEEPE